jgi:protein TonB
MNAQQRFRARHRRRLDLALCFAIVVVLFAFGAYPPLELKHVTLDEHVLRMIEPIPQIEPPPPPPEIRRPEVVIDSVSEEDPDEFHDTTFDPNDLPPPLPPPPPASGGFRAFEKAPRTLRVVPPVYPAMARAAGIEGEIRCLVTVEGDGRVSKVVVVSADADVFRESVIEALMKWVFDPAEQSGNPVRATVAVSYRFTLDR